MVLSFGLKKREHEEIEQFNLRVQLQRNQRIDDF
jgi:hypothetical protein